MKKGSTTFLQIVTVLIGIIVIIVLIRFPMTEGRAANLDLLSIYADPLIIYGYLASIPFFVALYQVFKLLGNIGGNNVFSPSSVKALKTIKKCALIQAGLIIVAAIYIRMTVSGDDDPAGFIAMSIITTFMCIVVATLATVFAKTIQNTVDLKSENDLTVYRK